MRNLISIPTTFVILNLLLLIKEHKLDELVLNAVNNDTEKIESNDVETFVQDAKTCGYVSTIKGSLEATESAMVLMQDFIHTAKYKLSELENLSCESSSKKSSRIQKSQTKSSDCSVQVSNCYEIKEKLRFSSSGIYRIWPRYLNRSINVFCDFDTTTGGWTVIQRRTDLGGGQENFYRNWNDYRNGFGDLKGEFWLGNDAIFALSNEGKMVLRVDMEDFEGTKRYALYNTFRVSTEVNNYKLKVEGYEGDAGNSFGSHNDQIFHTYDRDTTTLKCVDLYKGGWWYQSCHHSNLNGLYLRGNHSSFADGVNWKAFKGYHYSLRNVEMKVRPKLM